MTNVAAGTQAQAKKVDPNRKSSDVEALGEGISDLGDSVSDMASRHYRNARDTATDALDEATLAIKRNPYAAMHRTGRWFPIERDSNRRKTPVTNSWKTATIRNSRVLSRAANLAPVSRP
jgi:hypothetical protein